MSIELWIDPWADLSTDDTSGLSIQNLHKRETRPRPGSDLRWGALLELRRSCSAQAANSAFIFFSALAST
jgi:hypothetical protein